MLIIYDAVAWDTMPKDSAYLLYLDGAWPTYPTALQLHPTLWFSITTNGSHRASIADCESGDLTPQAAAFGVTTGWWDTIYCSLDTYHQVVAAMQRLGSPHWYWFAADPTGTPHLPPGASACQYAWHSLGQCPANYDISIASDSWVKAHTPHPPPIPTEETMQLYTTNSHGTGFVVAADLSHKRGIPNGADAAALLKTGQYVTVQLDDALINEIPDAV